MFTFFKKLSDPLTPCLLSESRFRGRTECGEAKTRRHDGRGTEGERDRAGERPFILSDKEKSWIGVYHTFNWTSSLCLAGRWKWTTGMCQLAPRPSLSPVHSRYQPPTISISPSLSLCLSCSHPPGSVLPPLPLSTSLPPSSFSLCVPSCVYLAYCFLSSSLCYPSQPLTLLPLPFASLSQSLYLYPLPCPHSPVSSLSLYNSL